MKLHDLLLSESRDKVFVFQSLYQFNAANIDYIEDELNNHFFSNWYSHKDKIYPKLLILHHHFIIISTCAADISGCSIDSLVHKIREIEFNLGLILFDRIKIAYFEDPIPHFKYNTIDQMQIKFLDYQDFILKYGDNKKENISILNTRLSYSDESWVLPLDVWLKKYVQN